MKGEFTSEEVWKIHTMIKFEGKNKTQIPIHPHASPVQLSARAHPDITFEEIQFKQCFVTDEGQSCWDSFTIHIIYVQSKHVWRRMEDFLNIPPYLAKPQWFTSKSPLEVTKKR